MGSIEVRWFNHEKYHYIGLHGLQTAELYDDQEQKDHAESAGNEKILQVLPVPQAAPGNEVNGKRRSLDRSDRPVALMDRAPDSKSGCWGFKSLLACQF